MAAKKKRSGPTGPLLAANRKASHEYELLERFEAGIALTGAEVKSARQGKMNLKEAYAKVKRGEVFLMNAHISPYSHAGHESYDPTRARRLLLHKREILKLARASEREGMTLVPTRAYLKNGFVKVEIAVARGKKLHDKRESKRKKEIQREMDRARTSRRRL